MAPKTPTGVPASFVAGDSVRFKIPDHPDYPNAESWTLKMELVGKSDPISITVVWQSSGDDANHWLCTIATADTGSLKDGSYSIIGRFEGSGTYAGREETVSDDDLTVLPDPRQAAAGDFQTHSEKMVEILETSVEKMVSDERLIERYGIAGRDIVKVPFKDRADMLGRYRASLASQRTGRIGRRHAVVFG